MSRIGGEEGDYFRVFLCVVRVCYILCVGCLQRRDDVTLRGLGQSSGWQSRSASRCTAAAAVMMTMGRTSGCCSARVEEEAVVAPQAF